MAFRASRRLSSSYLAQVKLHPRCFHQFARHSNVAPAFASVVTPPSIQKPTTETVDHETIARLAAKPLHHLTLADLVRHGRPPLTTESLLASANFALSLIPIRLAHRLHALRNLPFIVVSNPHITRIYNTYMHSLSTLLCYFNRTSTIEAPISNLEEEMEFTEKMADLVQTHSDTIPILARGFLESRRFISPDSVTQFLDEHLRARIGTRLIAEQHIALHLSSQAHRPAGIEESDHEKRITHSLRDSRRHKAQAPDDTHIGVIDTALRPADITRLSESFVGETCELHYGVRPSVTINGQVDTTIAHVPTHLEYILTELLKNAFRATVENGKEREGVEVTIAATGPRPPHASVLGDLTTTAKKAGREGRQDGPGHTPGVTIRIRDRGGGIHPSTLPNIWAYSFTTFNDEEVRGRTGGSRRGGMGSIDALDTLSASGMPMSSLAGLGYGLPLGRAYAEHFGGGIEVQSLWGWGTDVYLRVKGLGGI